MGSNGRCFVVALGLVALTTLVGTASSDELEMTRIGARTHRPVTSIEGRGNFQVDDGESFLTSLETDGISIWYEYTETVSDPGFADGDMVANSDFTWAPETCKVSKKRTSAVCNDKVRKSYIRFNRTRGTTPTTFKMKTILRRITEPLSDPLEITENFGEKIRFVSQWTDATSGFPVSLVAVIDRCDWKRGPQRTAKHVKCPTLCGGSPLAVCGSNYCVGSPKCN